MQTYWEHSEQQRAEMTPEAVESLLKLELMEAGVIAPTEPEYLPEEAPTLDTSVKYEIKHGHTNSDLLFDTAEDAAEAMKLVSGWKKHHWNLKVSTCDSHTMEIGEAAVVSNEDLARRRSEMEKAAENKKRNEQAREEFLKDCKAVEAVTENVWDDWHDQQATKRRLKSIIDTFDEYCEIAEGTVLARTFLAKAYSEEDIVKAGEWFNYAALAVQSVTCDDAELIEN